VLVSSSIYIIFRLVAIAHRRSDLKGIVHFLQL
jgi:hypothetical protein